LTFVGKPGFAGAVSLSGSGTLSLTRGPVTFVGSGALSGAGSLTTAGVAKPIQTIGLSGAGTLAATGVAIYVGSATLSGSGTLTLTGAKPGLIQSLALSGSGTLSLARGPITVAGSGVLSGSGTLVPTSTISVAQSTALSGAGTLTFAGVAKPIQTVAFSGSGALTFTEWYLFTANAYGGTATGTGWVNPTNAQGGDDSTFATWTSSTADAVSAPLVVSNFGTWSGIPAGSTIPKITVRVKGYVNHE
jgi:hypothetical protein